MSAQDFEFRTINGAALPMKSYAGKTVLLVNVASACGSGICSRRWGSRNAANPANSPRRPAVIFSPSSGG